MSRSKAAGRTRLFNGQRGSDAEAMQKGYIKTSVGYSTVFCDGHDYNSIKVCTCCVPTDVISIYAELLDD